MSYRAFKRLLGETSLERKCRFLFGAPRVAQVGYDALMKGKPLAIPGFRNKLVPLGAKLGPRSLVLKASYRAARPGERGGRT